MEIDMIAGEEITSNSLSKNPLLIQSKHLIDSMPFIDIDITDDSSQRVVQSLIKQEMTKFKPDDYLAYLPEYSPQFRGNTMLQEEYNRVLQNIPMKKLDMSRYSLIPPLNQENSVEAWENAVSNACAQLEHQTNRILNLELLQKYGADAWRVQISNLEGISKRMEVEQKKVLNLSESVNIERKEFQLRNQQKLIGLARKWEETVEKTLQIEMASQELQKKKKKSSDEFNATKSSVL